MARIYKRGRTYYADVHVGGKRVRRPLSTDRRLAEARLADLVRQRDSEKSGTPFTDPPWPTYRDSFLARLSTGNPGTWRHYVATFKAFDNFRPIQRLAQITPHLLSDFYEDQKKAGRGLYMRNRMIQNMKAALNYAVRSGMIEKRDWSVVKADREPRGRLLWYRPEELAKLLAVTSGPWRTMAMLCARAGLRRGEAWHLTWEDVDFERNRLHVAPKPGWNPKDYERRWVPLAADLRAYLDGLPRGGSSVLGDDKSDLDVMSSYWRKLVKKAGVSGTIHTLRHTFGAHLASAGVSIYIIRDLMGHASVETTQIYAHLAPESLDDAVTRLPALPPIK